MPSVEKVSFVVGDKPAVSIRRRVNHFAGERIICRVVGNDFRCSFAQFAIPQLPVSKILYPANIVHERR